MQYIRKSPPAGGQNGAHRAGAPGHRQAEAAQGVAVGFGAEEHRRTAGLGTFGPGGSQSLLHDSQAAFQGFGRFGGPAHCLFQAARSGAEQHPRLFGVPPGIGHRPLGPLSAGHRQTHTAFVVLGAQDLDKSHLPRGAQMGAAAGAQIRPAGIRQTYRAFQLLFAAVGQSGQLVRVGIPAAHRGVRPHHPVGLRFRFRQLGIGEGDAGVHAHRRVPDVKAHILRPEQTVQRAAEDVFPGVLFHVVQPGFPVDCPFHLCAHSQRGCGVVPDHPVPHRSVSHCRTAQDTGVGGLTAPFRVEGSAVQGHPPRLPFRLTGQHTGGKTAQKGVLLIQFHGRLQTVSHPFVPCPDRPGVI